MIGMQAASLEPGAMIAGKYKVHRVLAEGGMGVIVEAENVALGQRVAVKFLLPEMESRPEVIERFLREARAAARLRSDHVVRVFDIGTDERGLPFIVMELLNGVDIEHEIEARGPLPVAEAVGFVVQALDAIVEAHSAGIVHRDLKPANLFLSGKPGGPRRVRVLDFGISKVATDELVNASLTSSQSMLGSPAYMSPEQVRSTKGVDARTDVWALGVILYEMLTGASAFGGDSLGDVFAKIREEDVAPLRSRRPDVPEELAAVVHHCLVRDRDRRMPDAATLRDQLLPFGGRPLEADPSAPRLPRASQDFPTVSSPNAITAPRSEREQVEHASTLAATSPRISVPHLASPAKRGWMIAVAAVVLVVTLGVGTFMHNTSTNPVSTSVVAATGAPTITPTAGEQRLAPSTSPLLPPIVAPSSAASSAPSVHKSTTPPLASAHASSSATTTPPTTTATVKQKDDLGL